MHADGQRVAVFGAGGFVGGHLVRRLQIEGFDARVPQGPSGERLDIAGPLEDIRTAIGDAEIVVNAAGKAHLHSSDPSHFWAANATGAKMVGRAVASSPHVSRLIHVSSVAVGSGGLEPHVADHQPFTAYGASKAAGELAVAAEMEGAPADLVVVRPAGIGGDGSPGAWGTIRRRVEAGKRVPVPATDVRHDVVEIDEVVNFLIRAINRDVPAGVYSLAGPHPVTVEEYARFVANQIGVAPRLVRVPRWVLSSVRASATAAERSVQPARRVGQMVTTLTRQRPLVTKDPRR